jgi:hypothetical protein
MNVLNDEPLKYPRNVEPMNNPAELVTGGFTSLPVLSVKILLSRRLADAFANAADADTAVTLLDAAFAVVCALVPDAAALRISVCA